MTQGLHVSNLSSPRLKKDISFSLYPGEVLFIEGENGSGKSSLLRLLAGLATPVSGHIVWQGHPIESIRSDYASALHHIGHTNGIKLGLSVLENLHLSKHLAAYAISDYDSVLSQLNLLAHQTTQARYLSAGQKRRMALARLLLMQKSLWILDEPFTALDLATQAIFLQALTRHLKKGGMAVLSSHHAMPLGELTAQYLRLS